MTKFNTNQPWWTSRDGVRCKILAIGEIDGNICFDRGKDGMRIASKDGRRFEADHDYDLVTNLPDCTSWDWQPPQPIDPGEGWRLLENDELKQVGDECRWRDKPDDTWMRTPHNDKQGGGLVYRRRIEPPEPKYIPWTRETCPVGAVVRTHTGDRTIIDGAYSDVARLSLNLFVHYENLFLHYTMDNGKPCGTEVKCNEQ